MSRVDPYDKRYLTPDEVKAERIMLQSEACPQRRAFVASELMFAALWIISQDDHLDREDAQQMAWHAFKAHEEAHNTP